MKVIAKMQGSDGTVIDTPWSNKADEIGVVLSVAQLLEHAREDGPFAPKILSITIEL